MTYLTSTTCRDVTSASSPPRGSSNAARKLGASDADDVGTLCQCVSALDPGPVLIPIKSFGACSYTSRHVILKIEPVDGSSVGGWPLAARSALTPPYGNFKTDHLKLHSATVMSDDEGHQTVVNKNKRYRKEKGMHSMVVPL